MLGAPINKFTFPILQGRGIMISNFITKKKENIMLGRWKLKYKEQELEKFYRNIPDPGYFHDKTVPGILTSSYKKPDNHSDKPQN